eukprot:COSAG01_NODE_13696_length_1547_cov_1.068370_2_plen_192_part_00
MAEMFVLLWCMTEQGDFGVGAEHRDPTALADKMQRHESAEVARSARQRAGAAGWCGGAAEPGGRRSFGSVPMDARAAPAVGAGAPASGWRAGQMNRSPDLSSNKQTPAVGDGTWTLKTDAKMWAGAARIYGISGGTGGFSRSMKPRLSMERMPQLESRQTLNGSAYSLREEGGATQSLHFAHQLIEGARSP